MTSEVLLGSCLCGRVRYEAGGPFTLMAQCHCTQCRKASGAEFATNATVELENFRVLSGDSLLREFESSPGHARVFCGQCGSPIFKRVDAKPDAVRLRLGTLDMDFHQRPLARVFTSEKLSFSETGGDAPSFATLPRAK